MAIQTQLAYTQADEDFVYADNDSDTFDREHIAKVAKALANHDHTSGKGLSVQRLHASQAAGDVFYATSAAAIARLAKGTANQVLRMNSGATAPEWDTLDGDSIDAGSVSMAKLADLAGLSLIGRAGNTTGVPAAITGTNGQVCRVSGTSLGFGTVATAGIADDAVDDTKVGNRVPQFYRRQGGSSTNWNTHGTTIYTPTMVRMQGGVSRWTGDASSGIVAVTFPVAFAYAPFVLVTPTEQPNEYITYLTESVTSTGFNILWESDIHRTPSNVTDVRFTWVAFGTE